MSNILDTVQISGSSYDLKDKNAAGVSGVTQAEYDALVSGGTIDPNMFYVITDATPQDLSNYWTSAQTNAAISAATSGKVDTSAVTSSVTSASTDSQIPTAKAVYDATSGKVDTTAITSSVTSASTDSQIPTAKAVYDAIPTGGTGGGKAISAGTNISVTTGETADTVSCTLPMFSGSAVGASKINHNNNVASGLYSNAEGSFTTASNDSAHAEGSFTNASGKYSHAEGYKTTASNVSAHAEGGECVASGERSHAEGYKTTASTYNSHTEGYYTVAYNASEHSNGMYNVSNTGSTTADKTLFSVGNGTSNARHNAFEIRQNGDIYCSDGTNDVKLQDYIQFKLVRITQADYDALVNNSTVDSNTVYFVGDSNGYIMKFGTVNIS